MLSLWSETSRGGRALQPPCGEALSEARREVHWRVVPYQRVYHTRQQVRCQATEVSATIIMMILNDLLPRLGHVASLELGLLPDALVGWMSHGRLVLTTMSTESGGVSIEAIFALAASS